ncbi:hypothetical protein [Sporosarcina beigongshangi]|uniref:hypothetical protein n=1 Tax=Sporosarcina beigongshangi TaxID=2782538 RepID=UPI001939FBD9|nr:hypothetical protein [Sporosarcina beigongshangi]
MKFGKRYSKAAFFKAMLHGVAIGVAAVVVVGLALFVVKGKEEPSANSEEVPTVGPPPVEAQAESATDKVLPLFAKQHGAFSTAEAATLFIAEDPSLAKAAVIHAGDNYFVWSAVGLTTDEIETSEYEGTYRKAFSANTSSCGAVGAGKLNDVLAATEIDQIKNLAEKQDGVNTLENETEFNKNMTVMTAFTKDMRVVRLQLLAHYSSTNSCVKFAF